MKKMKVLKFLCIMLLLGLCAGSCGNDDEESGIVESDIVELIKTDKTINLSRSLPWWPCVVRSVEELEYCKAEFPEPEGEEGWEYMRNIDYSRYMIIFIKEPYGAEDTQYHFSKIGDTTYLLKHSYSINIGYESYAGFVEGVGPGVGVVVDKLSPDSEIRCECVETMLPVRNDNEESEFVETDIVELIGSDRTFNLSRFLSWPCVVRSIKELESCKAKDPEAEGEEGWEYLRNIDYSRYMIIFIKEPYGAEDIQYQFLKVGDAAYLLKHSYSITSELESPDGIIIGIGPGVGIVVDKIHTGNELRYECVKTIISVCH